MMSVQELLEALSRNEIAARELAEARKAILAELEKAVAHGETVAFAGYQAQWKPGRKTTDHEAAAKAVGVPSSVIETHTTLKATVAWAKVTKDAKVPKAILEQFTAEGAPAFVVEPIKKM
jgi:hypothetical protein